MCECSTFEEYSSIIYGNNVSWDGEINLWQIQCWDEKNGVET